MAEMVSHKVELDMHVMALQKQTMLATQKAEFYMYYLLVMELQEYAVLAAQHAELDMVLTVTSWSLLGLEPPR